jgi:hypothetical protein
MRVTSTGIRGKLEGGIAEKVTELWRIWSVGWGDMWICVVDISWELGCCKSLVNGEVAV